MNRFRSSGTRVVLLLLGLALAACDGGAPSPLAPELPPPPVRASPHEDRILFLDAARAAWTLADRLYRPETGLIDSVEGYPYATAWDMASGLAALFCANRLGLLSDAEYEARMRLALRTLRSVDLVAGTSFDRSYSTLTGAMAGRPGGGSAEGAGSGWSATDLGRLLVWLRIIAENQPRFAADAVAVVARIDFAPIVADGYLWGGDREPGGEVTRHQEGRVGYEQYAAYGFALWGRRADLALRLHENTLPITVLGVPLVADRRGNELFTSEPFVLAGLELGWSREMRDLASRLLQVQEARHRFTGQVTILSEDAVPQPPYFFYYYVANFHGTVFAVLPPEGDQVLDRPRWVSTKAAFAWHALLPSEYTRLALSTVAPARGADGWSSGVYEGSGLPTGGESLNTAAVILEAALFATTGRPLAYGS